MTPTDAKDEYVDWMSVKVLQKAAVFDQDGNVLLLKRSMKPYGRSGKWDLPGGSIDAEDLGQEDLHIQAIAREIKEETGFEATKITQAFLGSETLIRSVGKVLELNIGYKCIVADSRPTPVLAPDEHVEFTWVDPTQAAGFDFGVDDGLHCAIINSPSR